MKTINLIRKVIFGMKRDIKCFTMLLLFFGASGLMTKANADQNIWMTGGAYYTHLVIPASQSPLMTTICSAGNTVYKVKAQSPDGLIDVYLTKLTDTYNGQTIQIGGSKTVTYDAVNPVSPVTCTGGGYGYWQFRITTVDGISPDGKYEATTYFADVTAPNPYDLMLRVKQVSNGAILSETSLGNGISGDLAGRIQFTPDSRNVSAQVKHDVYWNEGNPPQDNVIVLKVLTLMGESAGALGPTESGYDVIIDKVVVAIGQVSADYRQTVWHPRVGSVPGYRSVVATKTKTLTFAPGPIPGGNLVLNPGFESGKTYWSFPSQGSLVTNLTNVHSGAKSAKLTSSAQVSCSIYSDKVTTVVGNKAYDVGAWAKLSSVSGGNGVRLRVKWINSSGGTIRTDVIVNNVLGTIGWTSYSKTLMSPSGTASASLYLDFNNTSGTAFFDDASLKANLTGAPAFGSVESAASAVLDEPTDVNPDDPEFAASQPVSVPRFAMSLSQLKIYPNPFQPGSGGSQDASGITFNNLTADANISIYTAAGEKVVELNETDGDGLYAWDGRNSEGENVASGTYVYQIKNSNGEQRLGRIAIVR